MKLKSFAVTLFAMILMSSMAVFGAQSPTAATYFSITAGNQSVSNASGSTIKVTGGSFTVSKGSVANGEAITLTASANSGKSFEKWIITGSYTIVSGSLTDKEFVIIPTSSIDVDATFLNDPSVENPTEKVEEETTTAKDDNNGEGNGSSTSPQTGLPVAPVAVLFFGSLVIATVSVKKAYK